MNDQVYIVTHGRPSIGERIYMVYQTEFSANLGTIDICRKTFYGDYGDDTTHMICTRRLYNNNVLRSSIQDSENRDVEWWQVEAHQVIPC